MTREEHSAAYAAMKLLPAGERDAEFRRIRSLRRKALYRERRQRDPQWWRDQCDRIAKYRRERAQNDNDYRHLRNAQAK